MNFSAHLPPCPPSSSSPLVMAGGADSTSFPDLNLGPFGYRAPKLEPLYEEEEEGTNYRQNPNLNPRSEAASDENPIPLALLLPDSPTAYFPEWSLFGEVLDPPQIAPAPSTSSPLAGSVGQNGGNIVQHPLSSLIPRPTQEADGVVAVPAKKPAGPPPRSADMVRVSPMNPRDLQGYRDEVRKARATYETLRLLLIQADELGQGLTSPTGRRGRAHYTAAALMRMQWRHRDKRIIGTIPGVQVGDIYFFRMELCLLGLHGHLQAGIDYVPATRSSNGEPIATSIIVSGGYEDDEDLGNEIIYTGHGGRSRHQPHQAVNQKLECGNLALERSMRHGIELRVIRGFKYEGSPSGRIYVYDGLYKVVKYWQAAGKSGFSVCKYKIVRLAGQDEMGSVLFHRAEQLKDKLPKEIPEGYLRADLSMGKEKVPVTLFNAIDSDNYPLHFQYLVKPVYPPDVRAKRVQCDPENGCQCHTYCGENCSCVKRNGGTFPYDHNGILLTGQPLIYECGDFCRCPPTCRSRVTQKGTRYRLEVFRSMETGWGVRSLDLIRAGSFICEYSGVMLNKQQADVLSMNGDSLVYPNRFPNHWFEWGDISKAVPGHRRPMCPLPPMDFALDVSRMRNVACYLSHSSSPNVFLQFVLYDHYHASYPHLMIFAMENIPPLRELSIDYGVFDDAIVAQ